MLAYTLLSLVLGAGSPCLRPEDGVAGQIGTLLAEAFTEDEPGAALVACKGGEVVYRGARGLASVELGVPVTPQTTFCLASVTKPFTAIAVMQCVEADLLALHEPVPDHVPTLVHAGDVTLEHLLSHTSGIPDMGSLPRYMEEHIHEPVSPDDLIATVAELPLRFEPGERFEYSNTNFAILARIVELVSEQSWEEYLREHVFEPAGMSSSFYGGHRRILPRSATGYSRENGDWERARFLSYTRGYGLGGLFSCVDDLAAWSFALLDGRLISEDSRELMFTPFRLNDGERGACGLSFFVPEAGSTRVVQHGGGIFGWRTFFLLLPDDEVFVAILTNRDGSEVDIGRLAIQVSSMLK